MKIILFTFFIFLSLLLAAQNLNDYDQKIVDFIEEYGFLEEKPTFPEDHEYWNLLRWFHDQGEKKRPAYIFLFKEKYAGDYGRLVVIVNSLTNIPDDQSESLELIRSEIKRTDYDETAYGLLGLKQACVRYLVPGRKALEPIRDREKEPRRGGESLAHAGI